MTARLKAGWVSQADLMAEAGVEEVQEEAPAVGSLSALHAATLRRRQCRKNPRSCANAA